MQRNFIQKIGDLLSGRSADKGLDFSPEIPNNYVQLMDGTHTYNMEMDRLNMLFGGTNISEIKNFKWYYENVPFLADCINIYADMASQVQIQEVYEDGTPVKDSEFLKFLEQPNNWQDQISFIKEMVINTLTSGINVQYGNFFNENSLDKNPQLYNIDFFNLQFPEIKNPYVLTREQIANLNFVEKLDSRNGRNIAFKELVFIYDQICYKGYGESGYSAEKFLNPISRISSLLKDITVLLNTNDTMGYTSGHNVNWIVSKEADYNKLAPLGAKEKMDIEQKLAGKKKYGSRSNKVGDVIATNEPLRALNVQRDNKKLQIIEMQNNAKENIRVRYGVPRDLLDGFNGNSAGSTYENQQFAEARFTLTNVKNITDSFLYSLEYKNQWYFKARKTKLIGTYDHMASVISTKAKMKNQGFKARSEALKTFLEAYELSQTLNLGLDFEAFLQENGFSEFLKQNIKE